MKKAFSDLAHGLPAFALSSLLVMTLVCAGCNGSAVATDIVNWTPALQSAVATVDSTAALLDPAAAPVFTAATAGFDAASNLLVAQCKTYLANPSAPVLAQLQAQVLTFQASVNAAVLQAARIANAGSQQQALTAINGVATIVSAILALVTSIKGNTAAVSSQLPAVKTSMTKTNRATPYLNREQSIRIVAAHYGESADRAAMQIDWGAAELARAGF